MAINNALFIQGLANQQIPGVISTKVSAIPTKGKSAIGIPSSQSFNFGVYP
jgi:hypothetical protein